MWDRGLHSYAMVNATITQGCDYLGRLPANVKFEVVKVLEDGSYLSWIAPDRKSNKKGATKIQVRIVEYTIDSDTEPQTYRLITSLVDLALDCSPPNIIKDGKWKIRLTNSRPISTLGRHPSAPSSPAKLSRKSTVGC